MTAEKIDGKASAARIIDEVKAPAGALTTATGMEPGLTALGAGEVGGARR